MALPTQPFFAIEASIFKGFIDPVGPADQGWGTTPNAALCQIETGVATHITIYASDAGYRTRNTDPAGVIAYPPTIIEAFSVNVSANLDPTQASVAAAWGSLTLSNMDHAYDAVLTSYSTDGQVIVIYRGEKTLDTARGIFIDPPYGALVGVFVGVMQAWQAEPNQVVVPLRDASYYLEKTLSRTLYGGTGGLDGTANLAGTSMPITFGPASELPPIVSVRNVTPQQVDPANLIFQYADRAGFVTAKAVYDGGVPLTHSATAPPPPGGYAIIDPPGFFQVGSTPVFGLTADVGSTKNTPSAAQTVSLALQETDIIGVPANLLSNDGSGNLATYGADPALTATAISTIVGIYVAAGQDITGIDFINTLLSPSGALLVAGRNGKLGLFVLSAIPAGSPSVALFDDSSIVTIAVAALPSSVNPPPKRMRLGYGRNWTVQTSNLAGATTADQLTFISAQIRVAAAAAAPTLASSFGVQPDPVVIGQAGGSLEITGTIPQAIVAGMTALWGVRRRLYEITVPQSVGLALDWGSIVTVTSTFDGLDAGKQGQIVGWRYSNEDATAVFRVLV